MNFWLVSPALPLGANRNKTLNSSSAWVVIRLDMGLHIILGTNPNNEIQRNKSAPFPSEFMEFLNLRDNYTYQVIDPPHRIQYP